MPIDLTKDNKFYFNIVLNQRIVITHSEGGPFIVTI